MAFWRTLGYSSYGALMLPCAASLTCVSVQCLQHLRAPMFTLVMSAECSNFV